MCKTIQNIKKCEDIIFTIENIDSTNYMCDNSCPICLELLDVVNYVVPKCGHKMCMSCFINIIKLSTDYGNKCSICRTQLSTNGKCESS